MGAKSVDDPGWNPENLILNISKEGFIHDGHRNRLSPQVVDQLVRVGQNWAEYSGEIVVRNERDDDETEEDVEVIE